VDFRSGRATADTRDDEGEREQLIETFDDISDARTFSGFGFTLLSPNCLMTLSPNCLLTLSPNCLLTSPTRRSVGACSHSVAFTKPLREVAA
jgi:hypothetical protein